MTTTARRPVRTLPHPSEPERAPAPVSPKVGQIVATACDLFLDRGFEAVTMDEVARTSGVSKATLYVYFKSKEDLFAEVMRQEARRVNELIWTPCEGDHDVETVLRQVAQNFVAVFLTERTIACKRAILGALPRFPEAGRVIFESGPAKMADKIAGFLQKAHERGDLHIPDSRVAARQFMSLTRGDFELGGVLSMPPPAQAEIDEAIDASVKMFLARYGKA